MNDSGHNIGTSDCCYWKITTVGFHIKLCQLMNMQKMLQGYGSDLIDDICFNADVITSCL